MGRSRPNQSRSGSGMPPIFGANQSANDGSFSGSGASGMGMLCSGPTSSGWNDAERWKIAWPCWIATTRRVVNVFPSRMRSTR